MNIDFHRILNLRETREYIRNLKDYEDSLSSPLIGDYSLIKTLYGIFLEVSHRPSFTPAESVTRRKKFIFIALYIFVPGVLAGDKMPSGFRHALSEALGVKSHSIVSNNLEDAVFRYEKYPDFRRDTERIYSRMTEKFASLTANT